MPFQKGVLVNWDVEKQIWDYIFGKEVMKVERRHSMLGDLEYSHCMQWKFFLQMLAPKKGSIVVALILLSEISHMLNKI